MYNVYDEQRGSERVQPPACRACFDCVAEVQPLIGIWLIVRSNMRNNQGWLDMQQVNMEITYLAGHGDVDELLTLQRMINAQIARRMRQLQDVNPETARRPPQ